MILPNTRRFNHALAAGLVALLFAAFLVPTGATADTRLARSAHGITEYELSNGLRVLVCPEPSKPMITVVMTYLVGSRLEGPGEKGMTHMLEHMLSKGTENFESIWTALAETGGTFNGTTWFDRTNFWVTLSASEENLDFALRIEADRMARAIIDSAELATEMGVISKELELIESEPRTILSHRMMGTAYLWHDYGHPTIGNRTDIVRYPIERLRAFYRRHYRPDNAVLFVGGDLDPERALALVERHFEPLTNPPSPIDVPSTEEPPQDGPRSVTVPWIGSIAAAGLMYHVPAASHEQAAAVTVLSEILTGPTGRLTRSLVDAGRASAIGDGDSDALLLAEPGVLEIVAEPLSGENPRTLLDGMIDHVENFDPPTERETALAKARLLRAHRGKNADAATLGVELSEWIAGGDWRLYFLHEERLGRVTPEDVAEAAKTYLRESNRTTGVLLPAESIDPVVVPANPDPASDLADQEERETAATVPAYDRSPESIRERSIILRLDPGLEAMLLEERTRGERAYASIRVPYGNEETLAGRFTAARCLPEMLMQGTLDRNRQELQEAIDLLEAEIEVGGIEGMLTVSISADRTRLPDAIRLAGEILRRPVFNPERFEIVRRNKQAAVEGEKNNPIERAMYELRRGLYPWPETSIHYMPTWEETLERWEKLELEGVRHLHGEQIGASHAKVAVVGDFVKADVLRALADAFEGWPSPAPYERIAMPFRPIREGEYLADTPGNPMAVIARATLIEMNDKDPDYALLELAARAFCEGSRPRIAERLRHEEGLSYYASGSFHAERLDRSAYLYTFALTGPAQAETAMESMDDEYRRWVEEGITEQELRKAKEGVLRGAERDLADNAYLARELTALMSTGQCVTSHAELRDRFLAASVEDVRRALDTHFTRAGHFDIRAGDFGTIP